MSHNTLRVGIVAGLIAIAVACSDKAKGANDPTQPCTSGATAITIPAETSVTVFTSGFQIIASVVDCHQVDVPDVYTWSSSDTLVLQVTPIGEVSPVGIGIASAILRGENQGQVGTVLVSVEAAARAARAAQRAR